MRQGRSYFGYFVLVSDAALDTLESLGDYWLWNRIEELFQDWKGHAAARASGIPMRARKDVRAVCDTLPQMLHREEDKGRKQKLGKDADGKAQARIALEKSLKTWLEQHSLVQIFDWFDCLEMTTVEAETGTRR